jgi:hypothetical protein
MKVNSIATLLIVLLAGIIANAQSGRGTANVTGEKNVASEMGKEPALGIVESESGRVDESAIDFILSAISDQTRAEFKKAWWAAGGGARQIESVVLLYRGRNRTLIAAPEGCTNQRLSFSFKWSPNIIAVVHTHPNSASPEPQRNDLEIADKYRVPVFTITNRGMFVYDPATKKTTKVFGGLAWLEPSVQLESTPVTANR